MITASTVALGVVAAGFSFAAYNATTFFAYKHFNGKKTNENIAHYVQEAATQYGEVIHYSPSTNRNMMASYNTLQDTVSFHGDIREVVFLASVVRCSVKEVVFSLIAHELGHRDTPDIHTHNTASIAYKFKAISLEREAWERGKAYRNNRHYNRLNQLNIRAYQANGFLDI